MARIEAAYTKDGPARADRVRRRGDPAVTRGPSDHPHRRQLADARGRHRLRSAVHDHRRAHQPDRPEAPRRGDEGRRLQPGRARRGRPGRGRRPHARRERGHPAGRRAGDPRPDDPARAVAGRRPAVDRLARSSRRSRPGLAAYVGQAARELRDRRGGAPRARAAADQEVRRGGRRDLERRHRHLRGPRRALRGRAPHRGTRGGPRHPARGRDRRPAGHADRRDGDRGPAGVPPGETAARGARRQHDLRRIERELRHARPRADQRGVPADGDRVRPDVGDHEPARRRGQGRDHGRGRPHGQRPGRRPLDPRPSRRRGGSRAEPAAAPSRGHVPAAPLGGGTAERRPPTQPSSRWPPRRAMRDAARRAGHGSSAAASPRGSHARRRRREQRPSA